MKDPTAKQLAVLSFIRSFITEHHYPPTMREINEHFGWKSTNAAFTHLDALEHKGFITRDPEKSRSIYLLGDAAEKVDESDRALKINGAVFLIKAARRCYFKAEPELSAVNEPLFLADVRRILEETFR